MWVTAGLHAQTAPTFTLEQAVSYAQKNSTKVRNTQLEIADAKAQVREYTAIGLPQVNAGVDYNYFIELPTQLLPTEAFLPPGTSLPPGAAKYTEAQFGLKHSLQASVSVSSLVFDGTYFVGLKASRALVGLTKRSADLTVYDLKHIVTKTYLMALIAEENQNVLKKNIENLDKMLEELKALKKNGLIEQLDVDRTALSKANLQVEFDALSRQVQLAYNALKYQMNYPLTDSVRLSSNLKDLLSLPAANDLEGEVKTDNRIELDVMRKNIALNQLNVQRYKSGYLPSLGVFGSYQQSLQRNNLFDADDPGFFPTFVIGASLKIPIFDGLAGRARIQRAKLTVSKLELQKIELERGIHLEVLNARSSYKNALERMSSQQKNLTLAERILNTTKIKYREGIGSSLEMTQAEQELYRTQANYLNALYEVVVTKADLDKALGN